MLLSKMVMIGWGSGVGGRESGVGGVCRGFVKNSFKVRDVFYDLPFDQTIESGPKLAISYKTQCNALHFNGLWKFGFNVDDGDLTHFDMVVSYFRV